jgi:hypothetical protein
MQIILVVVLNLLYLLYLLDLLVPVLRAHVASTL